MNKDYQAFLGQKESTPPNLDHKIKDFVREDLYPDHKKVFFKLTLVQGFIGLITMTFCPQFNYSLTNNYDLFHYFHHNFGHSICMIICGSIFFGTGSVFASFILTEGEVRRIHNSKYLYYTALTIIVVSAFLVLGAEIYLTLFFFWLFGALISGILLFEISYLTRLRMLRS